MKINYSKICSYQYFLDNYAPLIDSGMYDLIMEKRDFLSRTICNKWCDTPSYKINFINEYFRNEKNIQYKHLVMINTFFDEDLFYKVLEQFNIDTTEFISEINKLIILDKLLNGKQLKNKDNKISKILSTIGSYYCYHNHALIVLKIYELGYKKTLEEDKIKKIK